MIFSQYVQNEQFKTERATNTVFFETKSKSNLERIDIVVDKVNPDVMTGRVIQGVAYCIYKKKFINLTELANQIRALYINKGYGIVGYSKLQPKDFVKYATAKTILKRLFDNELYKVEIDAQKAANYFLVEEYIQL